MQQLLCEPEDRLGSQSSASVSRPNSVVVQARRSGFMAAGGAASSVDGAELIKVSVSFNFRGTIFKFLSLSPLGPPLLQRN